VKENESSHRLVAGELYQALTASTQHALRVGALQPIETDQNVIADAGVNFLVRTVSSLQRKRDDRRRNRERERVTGRPFNPFLPPEPDLSVGGIGDSHIGVLNKFNVLEQHLLIVTRQFEPQEMLLTRADLTALWLVLREIDGLGFYNGGAEAGASQGHKHLQLVPLPLAPGLISVPMASLFPTRLEPCVLVSVRQLPFRHTFCRLPGGIWEDPPRAADVSFELYRRMCEHCGIRPRERDGTRLQGAPYNLLVQRSWMMLVPRLKEHWGGVSINGLGYAGSLFVRNGKELQRVRGEGPMRVLKKVSLE
jgi:ATP adenylyltransferase